MQDVRRLVNEEHEQILDLVAAIESPLDEASFDAGGRQHLRDRLIVLEARHETAERLAVWPLVEEHLPGGRQLADAGREQETAAQYLLDALRFTDDGAWLDQARELAAAIRQHVRFEEDQIWPQLDHQVSRLGKALAAREFRVAQKVSPTRSHPNGPVRRPGLLTVGTAVAGADRLRDRLRGRRPYRPGDEAEVSTDAVTLLQSDCDRLRRGLVEAAGTGARTEAQVAVARAWTAHDWMEREELYPLLRVRLEDGNDRYHEWIAQHGRISEKMAVLDRYPYQDEHRDRMMEEISTMMTAHLDQEETTVLPRLRAHLTDDELRHLGAALAESRRKAPSRPHAHLAGGGRGARLSRAVLSPVDRIRDLAARR